MSGSRLYLQLIKFQLICLKAIFKIMTIEILNLYILICGFHGLFQSFALFNSRKKYTPNMFLSIFIFSFSVILIENALKKIDGSIKLPEFISFPFLFSGFTLYFYSKSLVGKQVKSQELILHSLPAFLSFIILLINFLSFKTDIIPSVFSPDPRINNVVLNSMGAIHLLFYLVLTIKITKRSMNKSDSQLYIKISWIFFLVTISFAATILVLTIILFNIIMQSPFDMRPIYFVWVIMTFLIYGIGYASLRKPELFQKSTHDVFKDLSRSIIKYRNTRVSEGQSQDIIKKLEYLLKKELLYREPDIKLPSIAKHMNIRPNVLSRIINEYYDMNFNQLINDHRIEEVKNKFADPKFDKYTIIGIAYDAGFNSKSSFNSVFKDKVGLSPKEFRNSIRNYLL